MEFLSTKKLIPLIINDERLTSLLRYYNDHNHPAYDKNGYYHGFDHIAHWICSIEYVKTSEFLFKNIVYQIAIFHDFNYQDVDNDDLNTTYALSAFIKFALNTFEINCHKCAILEERIVSCDVNFIIEIIRSLRYPYIYPKDKFINGKKVSIYRDIDHSVVLYDDYKDMLYKLLTVEFNADSPDLFEQFRPKTIDYINNLKFDNSFFKNKFFELKDQILINVNNWFDEWRKQDVI